MNGSETILNYHLVFNHDMTGSIRRRDYRSQLILKTIAHRLVLKHEKNQNRPVISKLELQKLWRFHLISIISTETHS